MVSNTQDHPGLEKLLPGFYTTRPSDLPFLRNGVVRSFVITAEHGPVVVYNSSGIDAATEDILALGGEPKLFINHYHEGMYGPPSMQLPVYVHERDRTALESSFPVTNVFTVREYFGADLEIIPSSSHTAGTTFFRWNNGEYRFLFCGDALWVDEGVWQAVILAESNREAFVATLTMMRDLEFDVLVPWHAYRDAPVYHVVTPREKRAHIDDLLTRITSAGA